MSEFAKLLTHNTNRSYSKLFIAGLNLVIQCFNDSNYREFIESVLKVHSKYVNLVQALFCNDQRFISSLDKACSIIINYKPTAENRTICRSSELVSFLQNCRSWKITFKRKSQKTTVDFLTFIHLKIIVGEILRLVAEKVVERL